ncbi:hypothetical protein ACW9HJ_09685 [Nocardia gipuzkoensis]
MAFAGARQGYVVAEIVLSWQRSVLGVWKEGCRTMIRQAASSGVP